MRPTLISIKSKRIDRHSTQHQRKLIRPGLCYDLIKQQPRDVIHCKASTTRAKLHLISSKLNNFIRKFLE